MVKKLFDRLRGLQVVSLTNEAARWASGHSTLDLLPRDHLRLVPEHGSTVSQAAGEAIGKARGTVPWYFHGHHLKTPSLPAEVEAFVFDLPLIGVRCFTYIDGLRRMMLAAKLAEKPVIVLNRPNPIGTECVEGPRLVPGFESEVACLPIPFRYGLSTGDLAREMARILEAPPPEIVDVLASELPAEFIPPSPNLRDLTAIRLYPALVWLEGMQVSEGRGTVAPFRWIGAPGLDSEGLVCDLKPPPGLILEPELQQPLTSKYRGEEIPGIAFRGSLEENVPVFGFGMRLLGALSRHLKEGLSIKPGPSGKYLLDLLWGSAELRKCLESQRDPAEVFAETVQ